MAIAAQGVPLEVASYLYIFEPSSTRATSLTRVDAPPFRGLDNQVLELFDILRVDPAC